MNKLLLLVPVVLILFAGCSPKTENKPLSIKNENELSELVMSALHGDTKANDSLSSIVDKSFPGETEPNKLIVREFRTTAGSRFFYVLIEFPNPLYNRFAVYDSLLNLHLMNKNLNGFLTVDLLNINDIEFLQVKESFLVKDVIRVNKINIVMIDSAGVSPALEIFSSIITPDAEYTHTIFDFNSNYIGTRVIGPDSLKAGFPEDVFIYSPAQKKYLSTENIFRELVLKIIAEFKKIPEQPEIKDSVTAVESASINISPDTIKNTSINGKKYGFELTLTEDWKEVRNLTITEHLKRKIRGTKFINRTLGSEISVSSLPVNTSSEDYVNHPFNKVIEGTYLVRYSEKIESGKEYIQFFECSCGSKKFLMIFETPKHTYEGNKNIYENIVNSFSMEC